MMEIRHVKLDFKEGIFTKRDLLNLEIDLIYLLKHVASYRLLKKENSIVMNRMQKEMKELIDKINTIQNDFPKEIKLNIKKHPKKEEKKDKKDRTIEDELKDIQEKLEKLKIM